MTLKAEQFDRFFRDLWEYEPFPWQRRLARQVCTGEWPAFIDLPTASGKTACLDIAVFALATQSSLPAAERTAGRRVFFVVNRRVIVDEAHARASKIASKLRAALKNGDPRSVLRQVAEALQDISGDSDTPPLDVALLRGGVYRDNRWARSITQPTIITSTIDQIGSRLLFRGYGVSDAARSIHAALIAQDSLILLDEAHISQPFAQTLGAIQSYRGDRWATHTISTPFAVVKMTATPGQFEVEPFRLDAADREHPILAGRRSAPKLAKLVPVERAKGKDRAAATAALAGKLVEEAEALLSEDRRTVAIIVNRIATARAVYDRLLTTRKSIDDTDNVPQIHLAIGRMRPIDRDDLTAAIQERVGGDRSQATVPAPLFVVATQCLEVGADFDFDAMVTECASLDSLRQRFGRLNRTGRPIEALGCVAIRADQIGGHDDPVYGLALSNTWAWLQTVAVHGSVDFGIGAMETRLEHVDVSELLAPRADAPIMFPAYVDAWAQTNPTPTPDPDVALFLHGPQRGEPDVYVCWRADLPATDAEEMWTQIVGLCPPSSPECMPVPIGIVRAWLSKRPALDTLDEERSDSLEGQTPEEDEAGTSQRIALAWRGPSKSTLIRDPREDVRPGDTLILPVAAGGWSIFGHIPDAPPDPAEIGEQTPDDIDLERVDIGEWAYRQSRDRAILRLTPSRMKAWRAGEAIDVLKEWVVNPDTTLRQDALRDQLQLAAHILEEEKPAIAETLRVLVNRAHGLDYQRYPDGIGVVLRTRRRIGAKGTTSVLPAMDDGDDATTRTKRDALVPLIDHTTHVRSEVERSCRLLPIEDWVVSLQTAAHMHDWGKADERFQALLVNGDLSDAWAQPALWAKSARMPVTRAERRAARRRAGLPDNFQHEILSLQLAQLASDRLPDGGLERDLVLHLIASHHGTARPFAPVVFDTDPPRVALDALGLDYALTADARRSGAPHRLDSGVPERFWRLTRHFGWWGLAYLEAILRLADQRASQREDDMDFEAVAQRVQAAR